MFVERDQSAGEDTVQERRDAAQNDKRILGHVVQCDGARAMIAAYADDEDGAITGMWTVGKMISINLGSIRTVGLVYAIGKGGPPLEPRRPERHRGQRRADRRGAR